jgi:hypothetical protein
LVSIAEGAVAALEPLVGRIAADTCVRATAIAVGKSSDALAQSDVPVLEQNIRRLLGPIAPSAAIDAVIDDLKRSVG